MKPKANRLWFGDNGRLYCTDHLGVSASMTGRDLSGQRIQMVTPADVAGLAEVAPHLTLTCEQPRCTRRATLVDAGDGGSAVLESSR